VAVWTPRHVAIDHVLPGSDDPQTGRGKTADALSASI